MRNNLQKSKADLVSDTSAGFTTGLFNIPEGMACAKLMGVNPVYGLYSSMATPLVALTQGAGIGSAVLIPLQYTIFLGAGLSMILYIRASANQIRLFQMVRTQGVKNLIKRLNMEDIYGFC